MTLRIAMWSGPRNISTAMMRAWENRPDCAVVDEPFYACYLANTGIDHPMGDEVMASQPTSWAEVIQQLLGRCDADVFYQKQMTHHMLPSVDLDWTKQLQHCFLVRNPAEVVSSYAQKRESITTDDIGILRQLELYDEISQITGQDIPVIDAGKFLSDPSTALRRLCNHFDIPFYNEMLRWPPGPRATDGVWAPHWYQVVQQSTGFAPYQSREPNLTDEQQKVALLSEPAYQRMLEKSIL